jgi:hypothetical protein
MGQTTPTAVTSNGGPGADAELTSSRVLQPTELPGIPLFVPNAKTIAAIKAGAITVAITVPVTEFLITSLLHPSPPPQPTRPQHK